MRYGRLIREIKIESDAWIDFASNPSFVYLLNPNKELCIFSTVSNINNENYNIYVYVSVLNNMSSTFDIW